MIAEEGGNNTLSLISTPDPSYIYNPTWTDKIGYYFLAPLFISMSLINIIRYWSEAKKNIKMHRSTSLLILCAIYLETIFETLDMILLSYYFKEGQME